MKSHLGPYPWPNFLRYVHALVICPGFDLTLKMFCFLRSSLTPGKDSRSLEPVERGPGMQMRLASASMALLLSLGSLRTTSHSPSGRKTYFGCEIFVKFPAQSFKRFKIHLYPSSQYAWVSVLRFVQTWILAFNRDRNRFQPVSGIVSRCLLAKHRGQRGAMDEAPCLFRPERLCGLWLRLRGSFSASFRRFSASYWFRIEWEAMMWNCVQNGCSLPITIISLASPLYHAGIASKEWMLVQVPFKHPQSDRAGELSIVWLVSNWLAGHFPITS